MQIDTKLFGQVEYSDESLIKFNEGLIGVSEKKNFILIEKEDFHPFKYLQSVDDPKFTLVVISPFFVEQEYEFDVHKDDLKSIGVTGKDDFIIFAVVVFSDKIEEITVNLRAPILINIKTKAAKQVLLQLDRYGVAEPLVKASTLQSMQEEKTGESR